MSSDGIQSGTTHVQRPIVESRASQFTGGSFVFVDDRELPSEASHPGSAPWDDSNRAASHQACEAADNRGEAGPNSATTGAVG